MFRIITKNRFKKIIKDAYCRALRRGIEIGRILERANAQGKGVILEGRPREEVEEILQKAGF